MCHVVNTSACGLLPPITSAPLPKFWERLHRLVCIESLFEIFIVPEMSYCKTRWQRLVDTNILSFQFPAPQTMSQYQWTAAKTLQHLIGWKAVALYCTSLSPKMHTAIHTGTCQWTAPVWLMAWDVDRTTLPVFLAQISFATAPPVRRFLLWQVGQKIDNTVVLCHLCIYYTLYILYLKKKIKPGQKCLKLAIT